MKIDLAERLLRSYRLRSIKLLNLSFVKCSAQVQMQDL